MGILWDTTYLTKAYLCPMASTTFTPPKFPRNDETPFYKEIKKRVNAYFKESGKSKKGDARLYFKTFILAGTFLAGYLFLVLGTPAFSIAWMMWIILGILTAGIGFNIMHDGAHGSYSKHNWVNELAAHSANMVGASVLFWKTKHNVVHHTYTNIDGLDDDIETGGLLRMAPSQFRKSIHKFQHRYFLLLYAMLFIYWVIWTDYEKYFSQKIGTVPMQPLTFGQHAGFWAWKIFHFGTFFVFPIIQLGFFPWLAGFAMMVVAAGVTLSVVFQLAHVVEETHFADVRENPSFESPVEWAIHQVRTTANFATKSRFITWFLGGLNFQIEHHLFPKVSHVHYPDISKIVREVCDEFQVTYNDLGSFASAFQSHVRQLKNMGQMAAVS